MIQPWAIVSKLSSQWITIVQSVVTLLLAFTVRCSKEERRVSQKSSFAQAFWVSGLTQILIFVLKPLKGLWGL